MRPGRIWWVTATIRSAARTRAALLMFFSAAAMSVTACDQSGGQADTTPAGSVPTAGVFAPTTPGPGCSPLTGGDGRTLYCMIDPGLSSLGFDVPAADVTGRVAVVASTITGPGAKVSVTAAGSPAKEIVVDDSRVRTATVPAGVPLHVEVSAAAPGELTGPLAVMIRFDA
jgi:hypothetical protein